MRSGLGAASQGESIATASTDDPGAVTNRSARRPGFGWLVILALAAACFGTLQFKHLSYPLVWQDEGETVMFGQRVLEHGYPKVDDGRNVVYGMGIPLAIAVKEADGAYIGSLWGQYYFAALAVWLADGVEDLYARTARLRMPFTLAGCLGLLLLFLAVAPAFGPRAADVAAAAAMYLLLLCLSTSLILHLREARYYALVVAFVGASLYVRRRSLEADAASSVRSAAFRTALLQSLVLLMLFNVFYPAAVTLALWLLVEAGGSVLRGPGQVRDRLHRALPEAATVAVVALICLPVAHYFEIASLSRSMSERWSFGPQLYIENLGHGLYFLLRYELLAPIIVSKLLLLAIRWQHGRARRDEPSGAGRVALTSAALSRLCVLWVLLGARNPVFFERYLVPLSPLLSLILLLDCACLMRSVAAVSSRRVARRTAIVAALVVLCTMVAVKRSELAGHLEEVTTPYQGPLDFLIPALQTRFEDPTALTLATNYEAEAYMYYLGSRVVGRFHADTTSSRASEGAVEVDVVIPRKQQPRNLQPVRDYLRQGRFNEHGLPVQDLPYNNIPELYAGRVLSTTHLFRTQRSTGGRGSLSYYTRAR